MTSVQAKERIERHLLNQGYSRKDGAKHTYLLHPDGVHRWKLTSRTVQQQTCPEPVEGSASTGAGRTSAAPPSFNPHPPRGSFAEEMLVKRILRGAHRTKQGLLQEGRRDLVKAIKNCLLTQMLAVRPV